MDRFFSRKSGSSLGSSSSAAQPALTGSASSNSLAQPAVTPGSCSAGASSSGGGARQDLGSAEQLGVKMRCLQDVRRWLATEEVSGSNLDVGFVRQAVAVLTKAPRPRQEDVLPLQKIGHRTDN